MTSETAEIPDHSCSSEDLCSLEVQGSLRSSDFSPSYTNCKGATGQSCSSLDYSTRCRFHRTRSEAFPDEDVSLRSRVSTDKSQGQENESCAHGRSSDCSSENFNPSERELESTAQESSVSAHLEQMKICCGVFRQPSVPSHTAPCFGPANTSSYVSSSESTVQQHHVTERRISNIVRSTSDPVSCSSYIEGRCGTTRLMECGTKEGCWIYAIGAAGLLEIFLCVDLPVGNLLPCTASRFEIF